ncbi:MAG: OmpA family protein [Sphingomonadaceae bacterium]|nr:OmpA family protein [Sphingomonadaceae bacterium]
MNGFGKFLVGAAATSLLAWGAHAVGGESYIDSIGTNATSALQGAGLDGVTAIMPSEPLSRVVVLKGDVDDATREKAEAAVLAVPGVSRVMWDSDYENGAFGDRAADAAATGETASEAEVATCQGNLDELMASKVINFRSGSAYMPESSLVVVDEVASALKGCDGMAIAVGGHTDATGSAEINQQLSQERADAVAAALAERGVDAARITATGYGSSKPKVPGDGANEANRRIEFTLGNTAAPAAEGGE